MSQKEKGTETDAAAAAFRVMEELCVRGDEEPVATRLWQDLSALALHSEVHGLLRGIADGTIPAGQSRLRDATSELSAIIRTWDLPRAPSQDWLQRTPFDHYAHAVHTILYQCGSSGLGIEGHHFDPKQRIRSGTTRDLY